MECAVTAQALISNNKENSSRPFVNGKVLRIECGRYERKGIAVAGTLLVDELYEIDAYPAESVGAPAIACGIRRHASDEGKRQKRHPRIFGDVMLPIARI